MHNIRCADSFSSNNFACNKVWQLFCSSVQPLPEPCERPSLSQLDHSSGVSGPPLIILLSVRDHWISQQECPHHQREGVLHKVHQSLVHFATISPCVGNCLATSMTASYPSQMSYQSSVILPPWCQESGAALLPRLRTCFSVFIHPF